MPMPMPTPMPPEASPSPTALGAVVVSVRQMGHCVILYSPGWKAIGPRTKHFQQKRWLQESSTMSEMASRQIGHCCGSCSNCSCGLFAPLSRGMSSESTSMCPRDSTAACSSAKSEPLKKVCRESQAALSAAVSSRPKCVCFRLFLRIFTTATAFQTAYFRSWSTSPRIATSLLKASGRCATSGPEACGQLEEDAEASEVACRSSERLPVRSSSCLCLTAKQEFTRSISASSSASNSEFARKALFSSCASNCTTTSLIFFFSSL
mmetsp:Transcript_61981/g.184604  ORF Transcript_61981/g.184604 Transcript_61981/m.184604 type:complete len:264 (-) Transcript_61981:167-958(-)